MKRGVSRRKFIASAAVSVVPSAVTVAQPMGKGLMAMLLGGGRPAEAKKLAESDWKNAGVIDLSHSPYAKLKTVPIRAVVIEDGFWSQRRKTNLLASIPSMREELL